MLHHMQEKQVLYICFAQGWKEAQPHPCPELAQMKAAFSITEPWLSTEDFQPGQGRKPSAKSTRRGQALLLSPHYLALSIPAQVEGTVTAPDALKVGLQPRAIEPFGPGVSDQVPWALHHCFVPNQGQAGFL